MFYLCSYIIFSLSLFCKRHVPLSGVYSACAIAHCTKRPHDSQHFHWLKTRLLQQLVNARRYLESQGLCMYVCVRVAMFKTTGNYEISDFNAFNTTWNSEKKQAPTWHSKLNGISTRNSMSEVF